MYRPTFKTKLNGVPVLSKKDIEIIGENFIQDFCPDALKNPQPIDVEGFIEMYLGLKVDYQYLSNDGRYLGMMVFNTTDKVVVYDPEMNRAEYLHADARTVLIDNSLLAENQEHRYRYTLAHEGGHDIFHSGFYSYDPNQISFFDAEDSPAMVQCRASTLKTGYQRGKSDEEWMEWQSNFFSSVLLMPAKAVRILLKEDMKKEQSFLTSLRMVAKTAHTFNVSPEAAKYRLEELKCINAQSIPNDVSLLNYGVFLQI